MGRGAWVFVVGGLLVGVMGRQCVGAPNYGSGQGFSRHEYATAHVVWTLGLPVVKGGLLMVFNDTRCDDDV